MAIRVVIAGGGTAGHVTPGLALAGELTRRGHSVSFVGTDRGLEARLVPAAGYEVHLLPTVPFVRRPTPAALKGPTAAVKAVGRCRPIVRGASVVVGVGGYSSVPAVLAARREHIPVVLHEQNAIPGAANRFLARWATAVALSFAAAGSRFPRRTRTALTGNPVRDEILAVRRDRVMLAVEARAELGLDVDRRTVVIFGGSLGALHVNRSAVGACEILRDRSDLQVVLIAGPAHLDAIRNAWSDGAAAPGPAAATGLRVRMFGYVDRMELVYAAADLVVARGGASSVAEIAVVGLPSLLIPYPHAVAGEQEANARALQRAGGASVMLDEQVTAQSLARRIESLIDHPECLAAMAERSTAFGMPDAASLLADLVEGAAGPEPVTAVAP